MFKSKIAMALAAAMVMAALYGCSSSDSGLKSDLRDAEADVTELQGKLAALAQALGITEGDPTAADIENAINAAETAELQAVAAALDLTPAGDTRQDLVDAINAHVAGPVNAFAAAQIANEAAAAAQEAVKTATKTSMEELSALAVKGESMTAEANAQAVLDAQTTRNTALITADTELAKAKAQVDEDAAEDDALNNALKAAIKTAEGVIEAANAKSEADAMKAAVEMVTGDEDADPQGTPKSIASGVAMEIGDALMPLSATDGGRGAQAPHTATAPTDAAALMGLMNNHTGMTFAEIVGEENLVDKRIVDAAVTMAVKAMSVAGMTLTNDQTAGDPVPDGTQDDATYKGIDGTVFCNGSDCMVEEDADDATVRKLVGSWYFAPDSATTYYEKVGEATVYTPETNYARYGHWLTEDAGNNNRIVINTFAGGGVADTNTGSLAVNVDTTDGATTLTDTSATYNGSAAGMSLHKEVDGDGKITSIYSGAFTATVDLTAKFGDSPTLSGMVHGFEGNAVDSDWRVSLQETAFASATVTDGIASASSRDGEWSATGYGNNGERPVGVFGGFNAHFTDGHAAGAYAAE